MKRSQVNKLLQKANDLHLEYMDKIDALMEGKRVRNLPPVESSACEFAKLFEEHGDALKRLLGALLYKSIESTHQYWHTEYAKINIIVLSRHKDGLLEKITSSVQLTKEERSKVTSYYKELKQISRDLEEAINASKRRVVALPDSKFAK